LRSKEKSESRTSAVTTHRLAGIMKRGSNTKRVAIAAKFFGRWIIFSRDLRGRERRDAEPRLWGKSNDGEIAAGKLALCANTGNETRKKDWPSWSARAGDGARRRM